MKTKNKHTPGPWTDDPLQDTVWAGDGQIKIATIADLPWITSESGRRHSDFETEQANARLIAASPSLLSALIEIEGLLDCGNIDQSHWDDCLGTARNAIKTATP